MKTYKVMVPAKIKTDLLHCHRKCIGQELNDAAGATWCNIFKKNLRCSEDYGTTTDMTRCKTCKEVTGDWKPFVFPKR